ncbi:MAG: A/G-specific adenine glycosylase [Planctomycetaceae bacterium]
MARPESSENGFGFDAESRSAFRKAVLRWYDKNGRHLPWRESADPYRIWLSEIMLQQTTVAAVVPYFEKFAAQCPDVAALAATPLDRVLRLWEGLGYYSRARNLHRAAQVVMSDHDGELPRSVEALQSLPGIGRYTAGAIASFAFNLPAPIVEANTERLYARLIGLQDDVRSSSSQKLLWQYADQIVPAKRAGDFNQALMDIGAQVCTPTNPKCDECPLQRWCQAAAQGQQNELPRRRPRATITPVCEIAVAIRHRDSWCLRRRTEQERWAGMWDFLRREVPESLTSFLPSGKSKRSKDRKHPALFEHEIELPDELHDLLIPCTKSIPKHVQRWTEMTYSVTRYRVRLIVLECEVDRRTKLPEGYCWVDATDFSELPLSITGRRIATWLTSE